MKLYVGMKAVIQRPDGKVLLLKEAPYDEGTETGKWDIPGGRISNEESIYDGLKREIMEESGLTVEFVKVLGMGETFPSIKDEACHIVRIYCLCQTQSDTVTLSGDHSEYEWVDPGFPGKKEFVSDVEEMLACAAYVA